MQNKVKTLSQDVAQPNPKQPIEGTRRIQNGGKIWSDTQMSNSLYKDIWVAIGHNIDA